MTEPLWLALGLGVGVFLVALSRVLSAEATRAHGLHLVRVEAMNVRNRYTRTILALRPGERAAAEPLEVSPVDDLGEPPASRAA
jgi:hypothetical protein